MTIEEIRNNAPEGATHYTPNWSMYVRVGKNGFIETWRFGYDGWMEIPMTIDECFLQPL